MRILRSQYLNYRTQTETLTKSMRNGGKRLESATKTTETTTAAAACDFVSITPTTTKNIRRSSFYLPSDAITITTNESDTGTAASASSCCCSVSIASNDDVANRINKRRQTVGQCTEDEITLQQHQQQNTSSNSLQIHILNAQKIISKVNVVIEFYREGPQWYSEFYRSHEGVLWHKFPRNGDTRYKKWYFNCHKCVHNLCSFGTLKSHLNSHMGFYPNRCEQCPKRYTSNNSLRKHLLSKHHWVNSKRTISITSSQSMAKSSKLKLIEMK